MVRVPTPKEEDRRRVSRERKTLTAKRVEHVNRIKGLLHSQGVEYEPLYRNRRQRLEELRTGDGLPLPAHDSPHFQTTPKALLNTVCSARVVANCSMRGWSLVSGMLGISS